MNLLRKWKKLLLRIACVMVLLTCVLPLTAILFSRYQGFAEVERMKAKNTAEDPNWQFDDLAREYNATLPPKEKNPFFIVQQADALLPATFNSQITSFTGSYSQPTYFVMTESELATLDKFIQSCEPALKVARQLAETSEGGAELKIPRDLVHTDMPHVENYRRVARLLECDVIHHAMHNRPDEAVQACRAILGVSRSIGSEPTFLAQYARTHIDQLALTLTEKTLNLTEPKQGLPELQADLQRQASQPYLKWNMRGSQAKVDHMFEVVQAGEQEKSGNGQGGFLKKYDPIKRIAVKVNLPNDHAYALNLMSEFVAASRLPIDQQLRAIKRISQPQDERHILSAELQRTMHEIAIDVFRTQGKLTAASGTIACERYRQKFGQWPESLEAIPKDILPEIPIDPCSGNPIVYERNEDHINVTSVGPYQIYTDGSIHIDPSRTIVFNDRLWIYDPALRRQPAPPKPDDETQDAPPKP